MMTAATLAAAKSELGRLGGKARTPAKIKAARANLAKARRVHRQLLAKNGQKQKH